MVEWITSENPVGYEDAVRWMEARVADILAGQASEAIWLLEHPPLYTAGTSANAKDLTDPDRFDVFQAQRGGQYTYHGPGQRVVYVLLDVGKRGRDVRNFVQQLENWVIQTLAEFNVTQVKFAPSGSAFGSQGSTSPCTPAALWQKIKSRPSASACANGSAFMEFPSMLSPIWSIFPV